MGTQLESRTRSLAMSTSRELVVPLLIKVLKVLKSFLLFHFTREIIEDTEAYDVSLKDVTPLEFPDNEQNDLWNITDNIDDDNNNDITDIYNTKLLGPGDAPPSNASL